MNHRFCMSATGNYSNSGLLAADEVMLEGAVVGRGVRLKVRFSCFAQGDPIHYAGVQQSKDYYLDCFGS